MCKYHGVTSKQPATPVCWIYGKNRVACLGEFGQGLGVIVEDWVGVLGHVKFSPRIVCTVSSKSALRAWHKRLIALKPILLHHR